MNNPINNGGPAFPCETYGLRNGKETTIPTNGMTLRDYFAGQAVMALVTKEAIELIGRKRITGADLATACYDLADAMLAAREVKP